MFDYGKKNLVLTYLLEQSDNVGKIGYKLSNRFLSYNIGCFMYDFISKNNFKNNGNIDNA